MKIKRALISVRDKTGLDRFVKGLDALGIEILSTAGTAAYIKKLGIKAFDVSGYTGFPEIMDGRVKTLHPKVHAGLLARRDRKSHISEAKKYGIKLIDMAVVNLYPFESVSSKKSVRLDEAIENIDIGGPSMLRSAAKNFEHVAVVSSPAMYGSVLEELKKNNRALGKATLAALSIAAFRRTSEYDHAVASFLRGRTGGADSTKGFPEYISLSFDKIQDLRYGENPHQKAAFYKETGAAASPSIATAKKLHGKELSFNNILDLNAALELAMEFDEPAACIIKHGTPCGVAASGSALRAFADAYDCDRMSAFGGIIGLNRKVDKRLAEKISNAGFVECIIACGYDKGALAVLSKKKNIRILEAGPMIKRQLPACRDMKKVTGGMLIQEKDEKGITAGRLRIVTRKRPSAAQIQSLLFAWKAVKHVRSNAIVICSGKKTVGIGAGQMSRIDSVKIAVGKAGLRARSSVLASDGFFPRPDSIETAYKAGVSAVIQPGGSVADREVIDACDRFGMAMVFTGIRHFKH